LGTGSCPETMALPALFKRDNVFYQVQKSTGFRDQNSRIADSVLITADELTRTFQNRTPDRRNVRVVRNPGATRGL
jgi:hypothetical protein